MLSPTGHLEREKETSFDLAPERSSSGGAWTRLGQYARVETRGPSRPTGMYFSCQVEYSVRLQTIAELGWLVGYQASPLRDWTDQALTGSLGGSGAMPQALADGGL